MEKEVRQRLQWVKLYEESGDAGLVCRRYGISRPTLRKWWKRYQAKSIEGLKNQDRRPHSSPTAKIGPDLEKLILELRNERNLGARRIQWEIIAGGEKYKNTHGRSKEPCLPLPVHRPRGYRGRLGRCQLMWNSEG